MKRLIYIALIAAMVLIAASWAGNLVYYQHSQLPRTMFLKHHIEAVRASGYGFELFYLENKQETRKLNRILIPELPNAKITPMPDRNRYTHQAMGSMTVQITDLDASEEQTGDGETIIIHTVQGYFSDGSIENMDIGEVRLYTLPTDNQESTFSSNRSSASSNGTGQNTFMALKKFQLIGITSAYLNELGDNFSLSIAIGRKLPTESDIASYQSVEETPLNAISYPISINKDEEFSLRYRFNQPLTNSSSGFADIYQLLIQLNFKPENGKNAVYSIMIPQNSDLSEHDVKRIVAAARGNSE
ncbi:hypothetical protein RE628_15655 [Paenibacillus sp. D2_2]|uniref:hypothetical protein n=1 Tax=Paenibacillus sp. D2_2 TaxID=3073092 RepID=UPI0028163B91|nr:hypothetical protein [Paenibacillus sp. D2_2]WMT38961.1 hypothetical protein RE628_15655 [Paenibacillus sp. D2_2]